MRLKRVKVLVPGQEQSEKLLPLELVEGHTGVKRLFALPDLRVVVVGERTTFMFWPANVVWGVPAQAPATEEDGDRVVQRQTGSTLTPHHAPVTNEPAAPPGRPIPDSSVAQQAEPLAVDESDPSSNLGAGAKASVAKNKRSKK